MVRRSKVCNKNLNAAIVGHANASLLQNAEGEQTAALGQGAPDLV
eukprot:CAMPEP_0206623406 /NCGR_PEP_ID=MMETSP0325_2-20121206/63445_1 /ASSEMBLY_ACC=CAM_ASM_000347 /TAXON_ID=2866 /ORGANISM="Crypthecodinium cohnii, Strain Seligo" /LENGTH=44 /DNA_ID= /DNA_START= /DNA_END= /DNA_ORIENTATION=